MILKYRIDNGWKFVKNVVDVEVCPCQENDSKLFIDYYTFLNEDNWISVSIDEGYLLNEDGKTMEILKQLPFSMSEKSKKEPLVKYSYIPLPEKYFNKIEGMRCSCEKENIRWFRITSQGTPSSTLVCNSCGAYPGFETISHFNKPDIDIDISVWNSNSICNELKLKHSFYKEYLAGGKVDTKEFYIYS